MEHGLDARLSRLHEPRTDPPQTSSGRYHFFTPVRFPRTLHFGSQSRRGCSWQRLAGNQNAKRSLAEVCQPSDVLWLDVRLSRQKAYVYGRRIWAVARMES